MWNLMFLATAESTRMNVREREQIHTLRVAALYTFTSCVHAVYTYSQAILSFFSLSLSLSFFHFKENKILLLLRLQTAFN